MVSNEVNVENSNASRSDETSDLNSSVVVNLLVLLVWIERVDGRPIELEVLTETSVQELCAHTNPAHTPSAVEILSPHELCLTYEKGVPLGQVAGELMAIESWMDFPILVTVVIIARSKVDELLRLDRSIGRFRKKENRKR